MPSHPKYPGLTAYKMGSLWKRVRSQRDSLLQVQADIRHHRRAFRAFRDKWGTRPPRTESQWLEFWREFVALEDKISDLEETQADLYRDLGKISEEGVEITRLNGYELADVATIKSLKQMLIELESILLDLGGLDEPEESG